MFFSGNYKKMKVLSEIKLILQKQKYDIEMAFSLIIILEIFRATFTNTIVEMILKRMYYYTRISD